MRNKMTLHEENDTRSPQDIQASNDGIMKTVNEMCEEVENSDPVFIHVPDSTTREELDKEDLGS